MSADRHARQKEIDGQERDSCKKMDRHQWLRKQCFHLILIVTH